MQLRGYWGAAIISAVSVNMPTVAGQSLALPDALVPQLPVVSEAEFSGSQDDRVAWVPATSDQSPGESQSALHATGEIVDVTSKVSTEAEKLAIGQSLETVPRPSSTERRAPESDRRLADSQSVSGVEGNRSDRKGNARSALASAIDPGIGTTTSPYGDMYDTVGLRPYKPGVRYDKHSSERDSSFFGLIFGGGRR